MKQKWQKCFYYASIKYIGGETFSAFCAANTIEKAAKHNAAYHVYVCVLHIYNTYIYTHHHKQICISKVHFQRKCIIQIVHKHSIFVFITCMYMRACTYFTCRLLASSEALFQRVVLAAAVAI